MHYRLCLSVSLSSIWLLFLGFPAAARTVPDTEIECCDLVDLFNTTLELKGVCAAEVKVQILCDFLTFRQAVKPFAPNISELFISIVIIYQYPAIFQGSHLCTICASRRHLEE